MRRILTIGEALIDFIPDVKGISLIDVENFHKAPGGAPANVACAVAKLGGESAFIGKLGKDAFGDFLINVLKECHVDTQYIYQTTEANTALAFVTLNQDGNREFSFYRNPSADMLLEPEEVKSEWVKNDILHFCSVSLIDAPIKRAHDKLIEIVKANQGIISFDPNVRLPLWDSAEACKKTIRDYIPMCDILKISDEELFFITEIKDEEQAIQSLFQGNVKIILYTKGDQGASLYTKNIKVDVNGFKVNVMDTTGAGDAFIGAFLYLFALKNKNVNDIQIEDAKELLTYANGAGALTASKKGAIGALPTSSELNEFLNKEKK